MRDLRLLAQYFTMAAVVLSLTIILQVHQGNIVAAAFENREKVPEHEIKRCVQTGDTSIECEPVKSETMDVTSLWPPGPYAIPMSPYGCPESSIHGWKETYLLLTWEDKQDGHVHISRESDSLPFESFVKITNEPFYKFSDRHIFGPAKPHSFKMNFCFKYRSNISLDVGVWPAGKYSIYANKAVCPYGFEIYESNISLPNISRWVSDGSAPDFIILTDGTEVTLQMQLCTRTTMQNTSIDEYSGMGNFSTEPVGMDLSTNWKNLFLIKTENLSCPMFENSAMQEETMYFQQPGVNGTDILKSMNTLCYYEAKISANDKDWYMNTRLTNAHRLIIHEVSDGETSKTNLAGKDISELAVFEPVISWTTVSPWVILDLGRTTFVSAVQINFHQVMACVMIQGYNGCYISNGKWDFLYSEAASCLHVPVCVNYEKIYSLPFIRAMEGRYVTVFYDYQLQFFVRRISYTLFTEQLIYDKADTGSCNVDLGLGNFRIKDDQISASSWLPKYPPTHTRPQSTGWCATLNDEKPYIEIEFPITIILEGITIYNWEKIISFSKQEISQTVLFGVTEILLLYKDMDGDFIPYNKSILFDTSRAFTQPQTSMLVNHIKTNSVRIEIKNAATPGLKCMKFELQCCYSTSNYQLVNTIPTSRNHLYYEDMSLLSEVSSTGSIISSTGLLHSYESDQIYRWIIRLEDSQFIKLIFTQVSFNTQRNQDNNSSTCIDSLIISDDLMYMSSGRVIDHSFQIMYSMTIETSETNIILSLFKCQSMVGPGEGFRAVVRYEDTPACFSIRPRVPWSEGQLETCTQSTMLLTSMTYLGVPFLKTTERWTISVPMHIINLQIIEFYVTCQNEYTKSLFKVINMDQERAYCNYDRPPDNIKSSYSILTVTFYKDVDLRYFEVQIDGFKMVYNAIRETMSNLIDYMEPQNEERNIALGKPAIGSHTYVTENKAFSENIFDATKATDGLIFQDALSGSCFSTNNLVVDVWWMVDLQGVHRIDYIVIYSAISVASNEYMMRDLELTTGLSVYAMRVTGFFSGTLGNIATIIQNGIQARYVRLQQITYYRRDFTLCEVMVFGELEASVSHTSYGIKFVTPKEVDGQWGPWSSWEEICYRGKQMRFRICDSPRPDFNGRKCMGEEYSYKHCTPESNIEDEEIYVYPSYNAESSLADVVVGNDLSADLSEKGYVPWLLVHLNRINRLVYVDISFEVFSDILRRNGFQDEYMVLSSGMTLCDFKVHYYFRQNGDLERRKSIRMNGVQARYVKLKLTGIIIKEFRIFSQIVHNESIIDANESCVGGSSVDGEFSSWTEWGSCSANCGHGLSVRTRVCNSPEPAGGGLRCFGDTIEYRPCTGNGSCLVCSNTFGKCYGVISKITNWKQARLECKRRMMNLVSILSLQEMHFIKTLLRERRYLDGNPADYFDADFYVHIGLHIENSEIVPAWENNRLALFSAWKSRQSTLHCTRMNFKLFDEDDSWESEDCERQLAEYIMCEQQTGNLTSMKDTITILKDPEKMQIQEQIPSWKYNGTLRTTIEGKQCEEKCESFNDQSFCEIPYCHDEEARGYLSCTTDGLPSQECSIKLPVSDNSSVMHYMYTGELSKTFSGKTCQRWDKRSPHSHGFRGYNFKGESISGAANYCRDPADSGTLWCFTTDSETRWEPCLLTELTTERRCTTIQKNTRAVNVTISGKTCLRWDDIKDSQISAETISSVENYCRDPLNYGYNWCYVESFQQNSVYVTTEPCQILGDHLDHKILAETENIVKRVYDTFNCDNGLFVPQISRCNGVLDCSDLSDEAHCVKNYEPHPLVKPQSTMELPSNFKLGSHFQCDTKEWISLISRCDGVIDCLDASDELNCYNQSSGAGRCTKEEFMCTNGDCIHISQVCNFIDDCIDSSDEYCDFGLCSLTEYQCENGQCISSNQRCDSMRQCIDGSDEINCDSCQTTVSFHCDVARCIPARLKCDGYVDCEDESDEERCSNIAHTSCEELWEAGYRQSGKYIIDTIKVDCKFSDVGEEGKLSTILNFDLDFRKKDIPPSVKYHHWHHNPNRDLVNRPSQLYDGLVDTMLARENCTQQIKQMCFPTYETVVAITGNNTFCRCSIFSFDINADISEYTSVTDCLGINRRRNENRTEQEVYFYFDKHFRGNSIEFKRDLPDYYLILAGPAICEKDYITTKSNTACQKNGEVFPTKQKCVFDLDQSGFPLGCRDGSHLLNCEDHVCPRNSVHCPGSYCIASRFVCDGEIHCPGGEDEESCGCAPSNNEIILIHDEEIPDSLDIRKFAGQFKSHTNIVRVLSYKISKPLISYGIGDSLLDIRDVENIRKRSSDELVECRYKVMARKLINSIHFTNSGLKGVILIQTNLNSEEVNGEILKDVATFGSDFRIYRVMQTSRQKPTFENQTKLPLVSDVHIKRWKSAKAVGAEYFSELCKLTSKVNCSDGYKCAASKICIPVEQVCDGHRQCLHGDDEMLCNFQCPRNCSCAGFYSDCSGIGFELAMAFSISKNTRYLDLSLNHQLSVILQESILNIKMLSVLNLSDCNIETVSRSAFDKIRNLRILDLSHNKLTRISNFVFSNLKQLTKLILLGNVDIANIETNAFDSLSNVKELDVSNMKLRKISARTFAGLKLTSIDLSNNKLVEIEDLAFSDAAIYKINFEGNEIRQFNKEIFTGLTALKTLKTPAFKFCCIRPNYVSEEDCYPSRDEFSSCEDLMRNPALQFMLWLIGVTALFGNVLTIIYRIKYDRKRLKLGFGIFVTNLAMADLLMGVYLVIIAVADAAFRKRYIYVSDYWKNSAWCNLAGVLSTISSEASVFFLCLITLDRLLVIKFPFGDVRFTQGNALACTVCVWLFSSTVALIPVGYENYFKNMFYSRTGVCIALPLTRDRPPGWIYSLALFIGLNFITFILVAFGQLSIFIGMKGSSGIATTAEVARKRDLKVARNLLLVVATDFLCWFPIGIMGILALTGHVISGDVYAWAAVLILPINSALNPILYTLTAIVGKENFRPSVEENDIKEIIKDSTQGILTFHTVGHRFTTKKLPASRYCTLDKITNADSAIPLPTILMIVAKLAQSLDICHKSSLKVQPLDDKTIHLRIRKEKLTGSVRIKGELSIAFKPEEKAHNVYELGIFLRSLINVKNKSVSK